MVKDAKRALGSVPLTEETVRFGKSNNTMSLKSALEAGFRKQLISCTVKENKNLGDYSVDRATIFVDMEPQVSKIEYINTIIGPWLKLIQLHCIINVFLG